MTPKYRDSAFILIVAAVLAGLLYVVSWNQARVDEQAVALSPESERLREELVKLSGDLNASSLEGRACRATLAGFLYELRKDSVTRRAALGAETAWQVHARAAFLASLIIAIAGLLFAIALLLAASRDNGEGQDPKVRSGTVALLASIFALGVMAAILTVDKRGQPDSTGPSLTLDLAGFVERCEDYRRTEE